MALHLNTHSVSWSLFCNLWEIIFKTNTNQGAEDSRVGCPSQEGVAESRSPLATLAATNPPSTALV